MTAFATVIDASIGNVLRCMNSIKFPGTNIPLLSIFVGFILAWGVLRLVGAVVGGDISDAASRPRSITRTRQRTRDNRGGGLSRR